MEEKAVLVKRKIIKHLYYNNSLSIAELCMKADRSLPSVNKFLIELMHEGFVAETGFAASSGGRRPLIYSLAPDAMYVVAIAMDQFVTRIAVVNTKNEFVSPVEKFELPLARNSYGISKLVEKIDAVINQSGILKNKIAGIGIGMPGFVDSKKGINYTFFNTKDKSIAAYISEKTGFPVFIDNDSSLIALAELRFGAARGKRNVMVVNIGWGAGLGMILNGELFRGNDGFAGEFSHIPLFTNNKLCSCGKTGCLETEASLLVVIDKAKEGLRSGQLSLLKHSLMKGLEESNEAIMTAAMEGDQFAVALLSEAGYHIGRGISILIHLFNPETIVLSGRGSLAGKIWEAPIQQALNQHCIPRLSANTNVEISTLGYQAELIGAASLVMENYESKAAEKRTAVRAAQ